MTKVDKFGKEIKEGDIVIATFSSGRGGRTDPEIAVVKGFERGNVKFLTRSYGCVPANCIVVTHDGGAVIQQWIKRTFVHVEATYKNFVDRYTDSQKQSDYFQKNCEEYKKMLSILYEAS